MGKKEKKLQQEKEAKLGIIKKITEKKGLKLYTWDPLDMVKFAKGDISLAQLQKISPDQLKQMAKAGFELFAHGKDEDARKIFETLRVLDPFEVYYPLALASIHKANNNLPLAEDFYTVALGINARLTVAYANRGEVRILAGKWKEAIGDLVKAVELDPDKKEPISKRARILLAVIQEQLAKSLSANQAKA